MSTDAQLPPGWERLKLADAGRWYGGGTPSKDRADYWTGGTIPWISPKDMKAPRLEDSEDHITSLATQETNVKAFPANSVLVVVRSGILSRTLPVAVVEVPATMNQDMKGVHPAGAVDTNYLAHFLRANELDILRRCSKDGTTVASIEVSRLYTYEFPLAPLAEQRRIVAKVEELFAELDAGVAELERVRANLKRYRAAVLKAAVSGELTADWRATHPATEPASALLARILADRRARWEADQQKKFAAANKPPPKNWQAKYAEPSTPDTTTLPPLPNGWTWASVEQCSTEVTVGHVGPMKSQYVADGVPFLRSQNVRPFRYDRDGLKYISASFHQSLRKSQLHGGELLIVRSGSIGEACVYPADAGEANCSDLVITRFTNGMKPEFAMLFVNSPFGKRVVGGQQTGSALIHFNVGAMERSPIPLPPLVEQEAIVAEVEARLSDVTAAEATVTANLTRAARLRQSILKEAFAGRLVPQDPADEPASVLLDRIKAASGMMNGVMLPPTRRKSP